MTLNPLAIPTFVLAVALFAVGHRLASRRLPIARRVALAVLSLLAAIPGLLMAAYYLHLFDGWCLLYEFRTLPASELTAAGLGLGLGLAAASLRESRTLRAPILAVALAILTFLVALPHLKPLLSPPDLTAFKDSWDGDVCRQSTRYSCGPACAATILRHFNIPATESRLARECYTSAGGTEIWYVARALRARGLKVTFHTATPPDAIPTPSIAGITTGGYGHFVTILDHTPTAYRIGDPLIGQATWPKHGAARKGFTGFCLHVE